MILTALSYFMEVLTFMFYQMESFEITEGVSVTSIIVWYLVVLAFLWVLGKIATSQKVGSKKHD